MASLIDIVAGSAVIVVDFKDNIDSALTTIQRKLFKFRNTISSVGFELFTGGLTASLPLIPIIDEFKKFEDAMLFLQTKLDVTDEKIKPLEKTIRSLGKSTSFTATEVALAARLLAQANFSIPQIKGALPAVLDLSRGAEISLDESSSILANTIKTFGFEAEQSTLIASKLIAADRLGTLDVLDLKESLKEVSGTMRTLNIDLDTGLALLDVLAFRSLKGTKAGTSLNAALINLPKSLEKLKSIGVELTGNGKDLPILNILEQLKDAAQRINENKGTFQELGVLQDIFNIRGARAISAILPQLDEFIAAQKEIAKAVDESRRASEKRESGLGGSVRRATSALNDLAIVIGKIDSVPLIKFLEKVPSIADALGRLAIANKDVVIFLSVLPPLALAAGVGFLTLSFAVGKLAILLGPLIGIYRLGMGALAHLIRSPLVSIYLLSDGIKKLGKDIGLLGKKGALSKLKSALSVPIRFKAFGSDTNFLQVPLTNLSKKLPSMGKHLGRRLHLNILKGIPRSGIAMVTVFGGIVKTFDIFLLKAKSSANIVASIFDGFNFSILVKIKKSLGNLFKPLSKLKNIGSIFSDANLGKSLASSFVVIEVAIKKATTSFRLFKKGLNLPNATLALQKGLGIIGSSKLTTSLSESVTKLIGKVKLPIKFITDLPSLTKLQRPVQGFFDLIGGRGLASSIKIQHMMFRVFDSFAKLGSRASFAKVGFGLGTVASKATLVVKSISKLFTVARATALWARLVSVVGVGVRTVLVLSKLLFNVTRIGFSLVRGVFSLSGFTTLLEVLFLFRNQIPVVRKTLDIFKKAFGSFFEVLGGADFGPVFAHIKNGFKEIFEGNIAIGIGDIKEGLGALIDIISIRLVAAWKTFVSELNPILTFFQQLKDSIISIGVLIKDIAVASLVLNPLKGVDITGGVGFADDAGAQIATFISTAISSISLGIASAAQSVINALTSIEIAIATGFQGLILSISGLLIAFSQSGIGKSVLGDNAKSVFDLGIKGASLASDLGKIIGFAKDGQWLMNSNFKDFEAGVNEAAKKAEENIRKAFEIRPNIAKDSAIALIKESKKREKSLEVGSFSKIAGDAIVGLRNGLNKFNNESVVGYKGVIRSLPESLQVKLPSFLPTAESIKETLTDKNAGAKIAQSIGGLLGKATIVVDNVAKEAINRAKAFAEEVANTKLQQQVNFGGVSASLSGFANEVAGQFDSRINSERARDDERNRLLQEQVDLQKRLNRKLNAN
jgi:TP901 family phage tail tape measure protein